MNTELRQIKWILAGILACLAIMTLAMVPAILVLIAIAAAAYGVAMLVMTVNETARVKLTRIWVEVSSIWRR